MMLTGVAKVKMFLVALFVGAITFVSFMPSAQAAVVPTAPSPATDRAAATVDAMTTAEVKCLTAFSESRFDAANFICRPLARLGSSDAQFVLGLMYAFGEGVERDMTLARDWLSEAARNGSEEARQALQSLTGFSMN